MQGPGKAGRFQGQAVFAGTGQDGPGTDQALEALQAGTPVIRPGPSRAGRDWGLCRRKCSHTTQERRSRRRRGDRKEAFWLFEAKAMN